MSLLWHSRHWLCDIDIETRPVFHTYNHWSFGQIYLSLYALYLGNYVSYFPKLSANMNFKIVKRKEVQTTWEQWPGSNCSNRRSFEQQINEQIRYAVQLYQFRMSFQLYSHNFTSQTENGNVSGNL